MCTDPAASLAVPTTATAVTEGQEAMLSLEGAAVRCETLNERVQRERREAEAARAAAAGEIDEAAQGTTTENVVDVETAGTAIERTTMLDATSGTVSTTLSAGAQGGAVLAAAAEPEELKPSTEEGRQQLKTAVGEYTALMEDVLTRWMQSYAVAESTPRIALGPILPDLRAIEQEARGISVADLPGEIQQVHDSLLQYMHLSVEGFQDFLGGAEYPLTLYAAQGYWGQYQSALQQLLADGALPGGLAPDEELHRLARYYGQPYQSLPTGYLGEY